ncbi:MAG TPA: orotate phosphoribosyltransferase [Acidimicrobiales bacterium]|jgi:orotate phosphoribosyltransferase|nr:orotate phosphoribosyltransferase [Acidimicrobiales bacterium]
MTAPAEPAERAAGLRREVLEVVRRLGYVRRDEAFRLSSGGWSHDYVDGKRALAGGAELRLGAEAVVATAAERGIAFEAVGGLTMGADPLAHAVAVVSGTRWFSVRKEAKSHGRQRAIEGAELADGVSVLLVEDVVTTGRSVLEALDAVEATGATVVLAVTLLDRGDRAGPALATRGVPYAPLATYRDLGIDPVGG